MNYYSILLITLPFVLLLVLLLIMLVISAISIAMMLLTVVTATVADSAKRALIIDFAVQAQVHFACIFRK